MCQVPSYMIVLEHRNDALFAWLFLIHVYKQNVHANHYTDVIMNTMAFQIISLTVVYSTVYSDADQRKHESSASLAFVWGIHRDRWIPRTKGQLRGKCFHLMTSSCRIRMGGIHGMFIIQSCASWGNFISMVGNGQRKKKKEKNNRIDSVNSTRLIPIPFPIHFSKSFFISNPGNSNSNFGIAPSPGYCNIRYHSETHLKLKSRDKPIKTIAQLRHILLINFSFWSCTWIFTLCVSFPWFSWPISRTLPPTVCLWRECVLWMFRLIPVHIWRLGSHSSNIFHNLLWPVYVWDRR